MTTQLRYIPCATFESAIHAYVDGELAQTDVKNLVVHLETCDACRETIEAVRRQVRLHQDAVEIDRAVAGFDKNSFFGKLNEKLVGGNLDRLAQLLYELGKAYFLAGNDSQLVAFIHRKAVAIERAHGEGKRLTRETRELATKAGSVSRPVAQSIDRAQRLFRSRTTPSRASRIGVRSGRGALDNARRFLEECLILSPQHV
ncbi:MAG: zf-HC2 domain-containing protein, partial [Planctomycetes bacterium]|nr:zf-HC2 domain-containing protein [Planctomycetota bacterium]